MSVEAALIISALSLFFAVFQGVVNMRRNSRRDTKNDASALTTVIVKLENIGNDISEIKSDLRDVKNDIKDHTARLVRAEQQIKVLNQALFGRKDDTK